MSPASSQTSLLPFFTGFSAAREAIARANAQRAFGSHPEIENRVREICDAIRDGGDDAVLRAGGDCPERNVFKLAGFFANQGGNFGAGALFDGGQKRLGDLRHSLNRRRSQTAPVKLDRLAGNLRHKIVNHGVRINQFTNRRLVAAPRRVNQQRERILRGSFQIKPVKIPADGADDQK